MRRKRAIVPVVLVLAGLAAGILIGVRSGIATGVAVGLAGGIFAVLASVFQDPPPPSDGTNAGAINFGK